MSSSGSNNSSHGGRPGYLYPRLGIICFPNCRKCNIWDNEESYNLQLAAVLENGSEWPWVTGQAAMAGLWSLGVLNHNIKVTCGEFVSLHIHLCTLFMALGVPYILRAIYLLLGPRMSAPFPHFSVVRKWSQDYMFDASFPSGATGLELLSNLGPIANGLSKICFFLWKTVRWDNDKATLLLIKLKIASNPLPIFWQKCPV